MTEHGIMATSVPHAERAPSASQRPHVFASCAERASMMTDLQSRDVPSCAVRASAAPELHDSEFESCTRCVPMVPKSQGGGSGFRAEWALLV